MLGLIHLEAIFQGDGTEFRNLRSDPTIYDRQEKAHRMMLWMVCTYRARAIKYRQENNEAVGGFFSQIGDLYVVHHLWGKWKEA